MNGSAGYRSMPAGETANAKPEKARRVKRKADFDDGLKRKYASAHDLRRAFGLR
jgi:hypothetical protein